MKKTFLLVFGIFVSSSCLKIQSEYYNTNLNLCINKLIAILLNKNEEIVHVFDNSYKYSVGSSEENQRIFINIDDEIQLSNKYVQNYILYSKNNQTLSLMLRKLNTCGIWHGYNSPRGKFLIVSEENSSSIFRLLWKYEVVKIVMVKVITDGDLQVFKAELFATKNYCDIEAQPVLVGNCPNISTITFPDIKRKLTGCKIRVLYDATYRKMPYNGDPNSKLPGLYLHPLKIIANKLNVTLEFKPQPSDMPVEFADFMTTYKREVALYDRETDIIVALTYRKLHFFLRFELSDIVFSDPQIWIVAKPGTVNKFKIPFLIFNLFSWLSIIFIFFFFVFVWSRATNYYAKNSFNFLHVFSVTMGYNLYRIPKRLPLNVLLLFYLLYCFHINFYFHGKLSSLLTKPVYKRKIQNVEELVDSDIIPLINKRKITDLMHMNDSLATKLASKCRQHAKKIPSTNIINYVYKNGSITTTSYYSTLVLDGNYKNKVYYITTRFLMNMEATYAYRKGYPLVSVINNLLAQIQEAGLFKKWLNDMKKYSHENENVSKIILTLVHLMGPFLLLILGLFFATIIFACEIIYNRLKN